MKVTTDSLSTPALIVVRRLRSGPLTEFELADEVAAHSGHSPEQAAEHLGHWLMELRNQGLIWFGVLSNCRGQHMMAAALTSLGRRVIAHDESLPR